MKNFLAAFAIAITLILAGSLYAGFNPTLATGVTQRIVTDEGTVLSASCASGELCHTNQAILALGDPAPIPFCDPGKSCDSDQLQLRAGDGAPMPVCQPGKNCNNDQLQLLAGDGAPMPVCQPGKNCNNDQVASL